MSQSQVFEGKHWYCNDPVDNLVQYVPYVGEYPDNCIPQELEHCHYDIKVQELQDDPDDSYSDSDPDPPEPKQVLEPLDQLQPHVVRGHENVNDQGFYRSPLQLQLFSQR